MALGENQDHEKSCDSFSLKVSWVFFSEHRLTSSYRDMRQDERHDYLTKKFDNNKNNSTQKLLYYNIYF